MTLVISKDIQCHMQHHILSTLNSLQITILDTWPYVK